MMDWKEKLQSTLRSGMRFCFKDSNGSIPTLLEDEFSGTDSESGFLDFALSVVNDFRKRCFIDGFVEGSKSCFLDMSATSDSDEITFDEVAAKSGAEKHWNKYNGI